MKKVKSPFLVFQDFITAEEADTIASMVRVEPLLNEEGEPQPLERFHEPAETMLFEKLKPLVPTLESHYSGFTYRGTEPLLFQQFPVTNGQPAEAPHCENAVFKRKRWIRVRDRDLTGLLWLKDYREAPPFDIKQHVLGGKLEFPVFNFGFQPQKGTLTVYPACERFISLTSAVLVGELQCVRVQISGEGIWLYDPIDYPGDFRDWFKDIV